MKKILMLALVVVLAVGCASASATPTPTPKAVYACLKAHHAPGLRAGRDDSLRTPTYAVTWPHGTEATIAFYSTTGQRDAFKSVVRGFFAKVVYHGVIQIGYMSNPTKAERSLMEGCA